MIIEIGRKTFLIMVICFSVLVYMNIEICLTRLQGTVDLTNTLAPVVAKSAIRNFQDENRMDLYSNGTGAMSSAYSDYLYFLCAEPDFIDISNYMRNNFSEGLNPTNYAIPYLDREKLEVEFNQLLNEQITKLSDDRYFDIVSIQGKVEECTPHIRNMMDNPDTWGLSSSFYSNTVGHTMNYNYNKYITYSVKFTFEVRVKNKFGIIPIDLGDRKITNDFYINYELLN